tara:strand:+ start:663 stop:785 length:123 start_codon:yes stop_codon:yes gene_type:complete
MKKYDWIEILHDEYGVATSAEFGARKTAPVPEMVPKLSLG